MTLFPRILAATIALAALTGFARAQAPQRPNILFIMCDDHAAHAISAYGSKINKTPNIDRLAAAGIRFDNVFATNSICTPSRATILTGKYSHLNGCPTFNRFDGAQPHVARYLQAAGYHTGMIGKWHLGSDPTGFDYWTILPGQGVYNDPAFLDKDGRKQYKGYVTDIITDMSIDFLKNRPKDKPFFLMSHHKAPHREWTPDAKHKAMFDNVVIPEPPSLWDDYAGRSDAIRECAQKVFEDMTRRDLKLEPPADLPPAERGKWLNHKPNDKLEIVENGQKKTLEGLELKKWKYQRYMKDYLACVQSVDTNVGRLLDYLDQAGLARNTVVIYTSDQGFFLGDHGLYDKRFMYEESLRMPFIVRWPGIASSGTSDAIAINCDFAPTFLDLAGQPTPADMQGRSMLPLFKGQKPADWRTSMYYRYYHDPGHHDTRAHYGIRTHTHKLIYFWRKDQYELYDLLKDPDEMKNVYNDPAYKAVADQLKAEMLKLKKEFKDDDKYADQQPPDGVDGPFNRVNRK